MVQKKNTSDVQRQANVPQGSRPTVLHQKRYTIADIQSLVTAGALTSNEGAVLINNLNKKRVDQIALHSALRKLRDVLPATYQV